MGSPVPLYAQTHSPTNLKQVVGSGETRDDFLGGGCGEQEGWKLTNQKVEASGGSAQTVN